MALFALTGMNVPMYNAIRRCIPFASMVLGYIVFVKKPSALVFTSIMVVTSGTAIAAFGDLQFDLKSYLYGISSVLLMGLHLIVLQYNGTKKKLSALNQLYVNSINCIPIFGILFAVNFHKLMEYEHLSEAQFIISFMAVTGCGCLLNYTMFLCTTTNSALTTTCVGVIKSGFTTVIGMFLLGGVEPTVYFITGQIINFSGGMLYSYAKYRENIVLLYKPQTNGA
nr:UDP-galactose/UDP-glucose transporter 7 [Ciona intestinalis]|eukprot:XP_004227143.2 UDP-galactose/UDP-glucose transporter 7 [Ciona intestinalis]